VLRYVTLRLVRLGLIPLHIIQEIDWTLFRIKTGPLIFLGRPIIFLSLSALKFLLVGTVPDMKNKVLSLVEKPKRKIPLWRRGCTWENNSNMVLKEIVLEDII
jgi:hypothetical protein